jgi:hypothetical protein
MADVTETGLQDGAAGSERVAHPRVAELEQFLRAMTPEEETALNELAELDRRHGNEPTPR